LDAAASFPLDRRAGCDIYSESVILEFLHGEETAVALKNKVDAAISTKISERCRELESELSKLSGFGGRGKAIKFAKGGTRGPVAPKYRNPKNPSETWAGRGLKPRWLAAAIKSGKKLDDFLIAGKPKASAAKQPKKTQKVRKPGK
jgi:DNA-binding protein H-NS